MVRGCWFLDSLSENRGDCDDGQQLPHRAEPQRRGALRLCGGAGDHQGDSAEQAAGRERQAPLQRLVCAVLLSRSGSSERGRQSFSERAGGSSTHDGEVLEQLSPGAVLRERQSDHCSDSQSLSVCACVCAHST